MSLEEILTWLEHGDTSYVSTALITLSDADRKALGPKARGWLTRGNATRIPSSHAALAVIATAGGWRQALIAPTHAFGLDRSFVDHTVEILRARDPNWIPEFVTALLEAEGNWNWRLARALVRANLTPAPDHPEYFRGTVRGVPDYSAKDRRPLIDQLDADPDLVGDHLINMLATEGTGRLLAFHDSYQEGTYDHLPQHYPFPAGTWRVSLLTLTEAGRLDRGRLLDTVLTAPLRDWASADLGWFVAMHDALAPSPAEVLERQPAYARLLTAEHGPSVKLGQRELTRIMSEPEFDARLVVDASRATLARTDKASASAQLRLLGKLAKSHPDLDVATAVRAASDHPRPDIRAQTETLLRELGDSPTPTPTACALRHPATRPLGDASPNSSHRHRRRTRRRPAWSHGGDGCDRTRARHRCALSLRRRPA